MRRERILFYYLVDVAHNARGRGRPCARGDTGVDCYEPLLFYIIICHRCVRSTAHRTNRLGILPDIIRLFGGHPRSRYLCLPAALQRNIRTKSNPVKTNQFNRKHGIK